MSGRPPAAVVFDFDGLILDTETSSWSTAAEVFAAHGHELPMSWWSTIIGTADHPHWSEVLEQAMGGPIPDRDQVLARRLAAHHALVEAETVRPGVLALLDALDHAGVPAAVASSSAEEWVDGHLRRLGIRHRFAAVRCRDHVAPGRTKPAPDLYLAACAAVDAPPARSVALEDAPNGVAAAKAAGLACVGVPAGLTADLDLSLADLVVGSLSEVGLDGLAALVPEGG